MKGKKKWGLERVYQSPKTKVWGTFEHGKKLEF
jgi:hypothetical protein